jgi:hypothetical protein
MKQLSADFDIGEDHALYILWVTELLALVSWTKYELDLYRITFYDGSTGASCTHMNEWVRGGSHVSLSSPVLISNSVYHD